MSGSIKLKIAHGIYVPELLPQGAERACAGSIIATAENICRRCHEAVRPDQTPEYASAAKVAERRAGRFKVNRLVRPAEEIAIRTWAKTIGRFLDSNEFTQRWEMQGRRGESEHEVYFDERTRRWFKRNNLTYHGTWLEYFHRIALQNWLFPETAVELEGITEHEGQLMPVVSQTHVSSSRGARRSEVEAELKNLGFRPVGDPTRPDDYLNETIGVELTDLHDENVLVGEDGQLFYIDPIPMLDETSKLRRVLERLNS